LDTDTLEDPHAHPVGPGTTPEMPDQVSVALVAPAATVTTARSVTGSNTPLRFQSIQPATVALVPVLLVILALTE
jgi:hypothetical protein